jgi:uncharacterized protein YlxW (UPF0749 family)
VTGVSTTQRNDPAAARARLRAALRPRATRSQLVIGLLFALLGLGLALQVRATARPDALTTARESDLVGILDNLTARNDRLAAERRDLEATRDALRSGTGQSTTALADARSRAATLGILAGTVAATGPGIEITVTDPAGKVDAATLLDAVQELRDAGAEAMQIGSVRVVAQTWLLDAAGGGITVDGTTLTSPYRVLAIGDPSTMAAALGIPGGVTESLRNVGADVQVDQRDPVQVSAVRVPESPQYARPAPSP